MSSETIAKAIVSRDVDPPQMEYLWRVELPALETLGDGSGGDALITYRNTFLSEREQDRVAAYYASTIAAELVSLRVYEVTAGLHSYVDRKAIHKVGHRHAADHVEMGSVSMTIEESEDGLTLGYFTEWMNRIGIKKDGYRNPPAYYKKNLKVYKRKADQTDGVMSEYFGFYPAEISAPQMSYDGSQILQYTVTFHGDDVIHTTL